MTVVARRTQRGHPGAGTCLVCAWGVPSRASGELLSHLLPLSHTNTIGGTQELRMPVTSLPPSQAEGVMVVQAGRGW